MQKWEKSSIEILELDTILMILLVHSCVKIKNINL